MFLVEAAFDQIRVCSNLQPPPLVRFALHGGYDYHGKILRPLITSNFSGKSKTVHFRHENIGNYQIKPMLSQFV